GRGRSKAPARGARRISGRVQRARRSGSVPPEPIGSGRWWSPVGGAGWRKARRGAPRRWPGGADRSSRWPAPAAAPRRAAARGPGARSGLRARPPGGGAAAPPAALLRPQLDLLHRLLDRRDLLGLVELALHLGAGGQRAVLELVRLVVLLAHVVEREGGVGAELRVELAVRVLGRDAHAGLVVRLAGRGDPGGRRAVGVLVAGQARQLGGLGAELLLAGLARGDPRVEPARRGIAAPHALSAAHALPA